MRVLHYMLGIPPVRGGGLIRYATNLMKTEREQGLQVMLLIPGCMPHDFDNKKIKVKAARPYEGIETFEIYNPLPVPMLILVTDEGVLRKDLFNNNVRDYQGETTINQDIRNTLENDPKSFFLMNNGVTIICSEFNSVNRKLTVKNPRIVNGCQTCSVLYHTQRTNHDAIKDYGFIRNNRASFFFHSQENKGLDFESLDGKEVLFQVAEDPVRMKEKAVNVRLVSKG